MAQTQSNKLSAADCRFANKIPNAVLRLSNNLLCCVLLLLFFTGGCSAIDLLFGKQQKKLSYEQIAATYNRIILKDSLTLDVLPKIRRSEAELGSHLAGTELLSSSEDTVASLGQSKPKGHTQVFLRR